MYDQSYFRAHRASSIRRDGSQACERPYRSPGKSGSGRRSHHPTRGQGPSWCPTILGKQMLRLPPSSMPADPMVAPRSSNWSTSCASGSLSLYPALDCGMMSTDLRASIRLQLRIWVLPSSHPNACRQGSARKCASSMFRTVTVTAFFDQSSPRPS